MEVTALLVERDVEEAAAEEEKPLLVVGEPELIVLETGVLMAIWEAEPLLGDVLEIVCELDIEELDVLVLGIDEMSEEVIAAEARVDESDEKIRIDDEGGVLMVSSVDEKGML